MKPLDMSQITNWLYVGRTPRRSDYQQLRSKNVQLIINMRAEWPSPLLARQQVIPDIWTPSLDAPIGFVGQKRLLATAQRAQQVIDAGGAVYVFCRRGRHRSVAMATAILLLKGYDLDTVYALFAKQRPVADLKRYQVQRAVNRFAKHHSKQRSKV